MNNYRDLPKLGYSEPKGCNGMASAVARETHVAEQSGILDKNLCELAGWVDDLERMLSVLLREEGNGVCGESAPEPMLVPHAEMLRNAQRRVYHTTDRIRSICNRLEL